MLWSRWIRLLQDGENILMAFIGNIAAAQTAKAIGNYNKAVYDQQYKS